MKQTPHTNSNHKTNSWLTGKHILITGGSSGIGRELAQRFMGLARKLTLVSRDHNGKLEALKKKLNREPGNGTKTKVEAFSLDVCDRKKMIALIRKIYEKDKDQVDVFINCAGGSHIYGSFEAMSYDDIDQIFDTNAKAPIFWFRELLPRMKHNKVKNGDLKRGHIVMLSSRSGERTLPKLSVYTAAKGAVEKLMEAMQKEYVQHHLVFTLINPGSINTAFTAEWNQAARKAHNSESMDVSDAVAPIVEALNSQLAINRISYESVYQWLNEPGVLID